MDGLNDSVVICNASPMSAQKKSPVSGKTRKKGKASKKTYYETPLKHIRRGCALKRELLKIQKKLTHKIQAANQRVSPLLPKADFCLQDSVIVLSDNESETSNELDKSTSSRKSSRRSPRCLQTSNKSPNNNNKELGNSKSKTRNRKTVAPLDASCFIISDVEDSSDEDTTVDTDDENREPSAEPSTQSSDDIMVVWSSKKSSAAANKNASQKRSRKDDNGKQENTDRLFTVDVNPCLENLRCLEDDFEPTRKRQKNSSEENETEDTDLPFSKPGLKFPDTNSDEQKEQSAETEQSTNNSRICFPVRTSTRKSRWDVGQNNVFNGKPINSEKETSNTSSATPTEATNIFQLADQTQSPGKLREIIIDGNNIGMAYTNNKTFSDVGVKLVVDYFRKRGHTVKAFVPQYRRSLRYPILEQLYAEGIIVFTPSRSIGGKRITPYDDRFILQYATVCEGIVVSLDQYRDLYAEKPEWRSTIEKRLLAPTFVGNYIMFPEDPLGRGGPNLEQFLKH